MELRCEQRRQLYYKKKKFCTCLETGTVNATYKGLFTVIILIMARVMTHTNYSVIQR